MKYKFKNKDEHIINIIDHLDVLGKKPNCRVVLRVDRQRFVAMLRTAFLN